MIAQAQKIEVEGDASSSPFAPQHRALRAQLEQTRPLLETIASQLAAADDVSRAKPKAAIRRQRRLPPVPPAPGAPQARADRDARRSEERALEDPACRTMLDVFAAEIKDVEEM